MDHTNMTSTIHVIYFYVQCVGRIQRSRFVKQCCIIYLSLAARSQLPACLKMLSAIHRFVSKCLHGKCNKPFEDIAYYDHKISSIHVSLIYIQQSSLESFLVDYVSKLLNIITYFLLNLILFYLVKLYVRYDK